VTQAGFAAAVGRHAPEAEFDVIVCGAGSAGSTVAGMLAADDDLRVLLLEAGPDDADERVSDPDRWFENLGSERDWGFVTEPGRHIDQRRLPSEPRGGADPQTPHALGCRARRTPGSAGHRCS
jgi:choline dehydrogenase-like flavoprotein